MIKRINWVLLINNFFKFRTTEDKVNYMKFDKSTNSISSSQFYGRDEGPEDNDYDTSFRQIKLFLNIF